MMTVDAGDQAISTFVHLALALQRRSA